MDPKKLALPDQVLSPRRKVVSGLVLWVGASLFTLSLLLLSSSFKGRVFAPLLQGFDTVSDNSSFVPWRFSFPTSHSPSSVTSNDSDAKEMHSSEDLIANAPEADALQVQVLLKNFHLVNSTENVKNGSMTVGEGTVIEKTQEAKVGNFLESSGNGSVLESTHLGSASDMVENGSLPCAEGISIRNFSLTGDGCIDANRSTEGKSVLNSSTVNNTVTNYRVNGSLLYKEEVYTSLGGEEENRNASFETCNIFDGRWVRDDSKPYYPAGSCPHIDRDFNCHLNGRPDDGFVKWKWQPNGCNIPRYALLL